MLTFLRGMTFVRRCIRDGNWVCRSNMNEIYFITVEGNMLVFLFLLKNLFHETNANVRDQ